MEDDAPHRWIVTTKWSAKGRGRWNVPLAVPGKQVLQLSIVFIKIAAHKSDPNYLVNTCTGGRTDISNIHIKLSRVERN